jgi:ABC-type proline/glycine betaine transport system permease subunit
METRSNNNFGLSKKTNVSMAAITGITIVANAGMWQSIMGTIAICAIAFYQLTIQGRIDLKKEKGAES